MKRLALHAVVLLTLSACTESTRPAAPPSPQGDVALSVTAACPTPVNVVVHDGVVELSGVLTDERERQAFVVVAENVPGVKVVHDHLAWVEPFSGMILQSEKDGTHVKAF